MKDNSIINHSNDNYSPQIFICYAHKDNENRDPSKQWLDRLLEHLAPLELQGQADIWSDKEIELGEQWHEKIQGTLNQVKAAILLVSPSFLASKYIRNSELPVLLKNFWKPVQRKRLFLNPYNPKLSLLPREVMRRQG